MKRLIAALAVVALLAAGCGDDEDEDASTTETTEQPQAARLAVEASEYSFEAPDQVAAGLVTMEFENAGRLNHEGFLLSIGDRPEEEALSAFEAWWVQGQGSLPEFLTAGGGVAEVKAGDSQEVQVSLGPGRFLLLCTLNDAESQEQEGPPSPDQAQPPHFRQGMSKLITVTGGAAGATPAEPSAEGTVTGREYSFDVPALTAGTKQLVFRNEGPDQIHHLELHEFPAGVDEAAAQQSYAALAQAQISGMPPPPGTPFPTEKGGAQAIRPEGSETFRAELLPGRTYAVVCFVPDREGGPPHIAKGMLKTFTVP